MKRALVAALLLSGCGTPAWVDYTRTLTNLGQCDAARQEVMKNAGDLEQRALWLGAVYADCDKNRPEAIRWLTIAARYGNSSAREALLQLNAPIPTADLGRKSCVMLGMMLSCD